MPHCTISKQYHLPTYCLAVVATLFLKLCTLTKEDTEVKDTAPLLVKPQMPDLMPNYLLYILRLLLLKTTMNIHLIQRSWDENNHHNGYKVDICRWYREHILQIRNLFWLVIAWWSQTLNCSMHAYTMIIKSRWFCQAAK